MTRDARQPGGVARPTLPYSPVVVAGDLVFTAGQVALDARGDLVAGGIEEQTAQVLDNLARCLDTAGCSMEDVVKVTAYLADLTDSEGYNRVYAERFAPPYPARSTIGARLADNLLVEIEAVARRTGDGASI